MCFYKVITVLLLTSRSSERTCPYLFNIRVTDSVIMMGLCVCVISNLQIKHGRDLIMDLG